MVIGQFNGHRLCHAPHSEIISDAVVTLIIATITTVYSKYNKNNDNDNYIIICLF